MHPIADKQSKASLEKYVKAAVNRITGSGHFYRMTTLSKDEAGNPRFSVIVSRAYASAGGIISETLSPMVAQLQGAGISVDVKEEKRIAPDATDDYKLHITVPQGAEAVRKLNMLARDVTKTPDINAHDPNVESPIETLVGLRPSGWQL